MTMQYAIEHARNLSVRLVLFMFVTYNGMQGQNFCSSMKTLAFSAVVGVHPVAKTLRDWVGAQCSPELMDS
jgi:hypothetical protein